MMEVHLLLTFPTAGQVAVSLLTTIANLIRPLNKIRMACQRSDMKDVDPEKR